MSRQKEAYAKALEELGLQMNGADSVVAVNKTGRAHLDLIYVNRVKRNSHESPTLVIAKDVNCISYC